MTQLKKLKLEQQTACQVCSSRRLAWFKPCNTKTLEIHQNFRDAQYNLEAGDFLFMQGETPHSVYTLQEGWVICFKSLANGRRQILHVGLAGDFIGYRSDFSQPIDYSVMALTNSKVCGFSDKNINALIQADAQLIGRLLEIQSENNQQCRTNLSYVGQAPAKYKVAYFLSNIISRLGERGVDISKSIYFPLTREEIADAIGITSVHLCRISVELRRSNIVDCRHNRLDIIDPKQLETLASSVF